MSRNARVALFWLAALIVLIALLQTFSSILLPFVAGAALAYLLDPVADRLERLGLGRLAATILILLLMVVVVLIALLSLGPVLAFQLSELVTRLPGYFENLQGLLDRFFNSRLAEFFGIKADDIRGALSGFLTDGAELARTVIGSIWSGGMALVNIGSLFVITPFIVFYLLRDWDEIIRKVDGLLPRDYADDIRMLAREIDAKVASFVRGQFLVGFLLGIFYAIGLILVGLNYGLLIGLLSGIFSFVPYLGFTIGIVISVMLAFAQFWPDWIWIGAVVAVFAVGQILEGYVLQPRFLGRSVGLHPVWLFFSLFAFGLLFGFVGLLIAIPAAAAVGVLLKFGLERYRDSAFYRGHGEGAPSEPASGTSGGEDS